MTTIKIIACLNILIALALAQYDDGADADTVISNKINYLIYPYVFYTPETQLAAGLGGMIYFRMAPSKNLRPSKILLSGYYTTNKQYYIKFAPVIYFRGYDQNMIDMLITYSKEIWKFYGAGNNTPEIENPDYTMHSLRLVVEIQGRSYIYENINSGFTYEYSYNDIVDKQSNPFLRGNIVTGDDGGTISGLGWGWLYDRRDNIFYPSKNGYYKLRAMFFGRSLGSDFTFNRILIDLRQFFTLPKDHIMAVQFYADLTTGNPPFFNLPALGGANRMRGYFEARYRDRLYMMAQAEYRKIIWWRFGVVGFLGTGDVANKFSQFNTNTLKFSYGFGLRFVFDEREKLNIRVDMGFGKNTDGIYFALEEAF